MMHAKSDSMGITQYVTLFMAWLREATVDPQKVISSLTSVDLADTTLE